MVNDEDDAFEQELKAAPWGYGQKQGDRIATAISKLRQSGFGEEAFVLELEIKTLKAEVEYLRNR